MQRDLSRQSRVIAAAREASEASRLRFAPDKIEAPIGYRGTYRIRGTGRQFKEPQFFGQCDVGTGEPFSVVTIPQPVTMIVCDGKRPRPIN